MSLLAVFLGKINRACVIFIRCMQFKNVNFNVKSEWIMSFLDNEDGFVSRAEIVEHLSVFDVSYDVVAENTRKMEVAGLVEFDTEPKKNVEDKKIYKINSDELNQYIEENGELVTPIDFAKDRIQNLEENIEEQRSRISHLESDLKSLENTVETLTDMFNSRGDRMSKLERDEEKINDAMDAHEFYVKQVLEYMEGQDIDVEYWSE